MGMKHSRWKAMAAIGAVMIAAMPALADVKDGVDAWTRGDYDRAVAEWRGPAAKGDADAQFNLGQAYKLGRGVPADLNQAELWYQKAALQGHREAEDNYGLALFQNGKQAQALPWLQKSADRGEPRAQYVLGTIYFNGEYAPKDWVRAYALMSRASSAGLPQASRTLTEMGRYVSLDDRQKGLELARKYERQAIVDDNAVTLANRDAPKPAVPQTEPPQRGTVTRTEIPPSDAYGYGYGSTTHAQPAQPPISAPSVAQPSAPVATPAPAKPAPAPAPAAPAPSGNWAIQLGAFGEPGNAQKLWAKVSGNYPRRDVSYVRAGRLTKVLVGPYASRAQAQAACRSVNPCLPVRK